MRREVAVNINRANPHPADCLGDGKSQERAARRPLAKQLSTTSKSNHPRKEEIGNS